MRILVTGAAGFLGKECAAQLRSRGHHVLTTDRSGTVDHAGDLAIIDFVQSLPVVDAIVHCAAVQYVSSDLPLLRRTEYFHKNNFLATQNICDKYQSTGVHMVNIGTSMMYAQDGLPSYDVNSVMRAQGVYSASKLMAYHYIQRSFDDSATVIPCIIGGIGREGLFRGFVKSIQARGIAVFPGSGTNLTHMVHARDVAALVVCVVETRSRGLFNAAAPAPLSIQEWVHIIADELRLPAPRLVRLPLKPIHGLAAMTGYRLLAQEQLLMLAQSHVIDTGSSNAIGWHAELNNERIVRDIAKYISTVSRPPRNASSKIDL